MVLASVLVSHAATREFHQLPQNFDVKAGICPGPTKWGAEYPRLDSLCTVARPQDGNVRGATVAHELTHALGGTYDPK